MALLSLPDCHWLVVRKVSVEHILTESWRTPHTLMSWARVDSTAIAYPQEAPVAETTGCSMR